MREQVTAAILDAAEQTLVERGLDGASTAAIAARAGVAVGTLYNYFPDRDSLLSSLFRARREEMLPRLAEAIRAAAKGSFEQRLRTFLTGVLGVFEEQRAFMRVVVAVDAKALEVKGRNPAVLVASTEALVDILRVPCGKRAEEYARMIIGAMKALVLWRVDQDIPFTEDADRLADTFLHGIQRK